MTKIVTLMLNPSVDVMLQFDGFEKTKTNRIINEISHMGGKGLNVSFVAKSFGLSVCATGFIGSDKKDELSDILKKADIENAFVEVSGKTRTNFKLLDSKEGSVTEANGMGFTVTEEDIKKLEKNLEESLNDAEILVLTGSLPKGIDKDFYAKCIEKANAKGIKTVLDASGEALKLALSEKPYAIKPNIDELSEYCGKTITDEKEILSVMKQLTDDGIGLVIVSMGADGAFFAKDGKFISAKTFKIDFKSAVGAGDSMVGAVCYGMANNIDIEKTARLGISAGCITTSKIATNLCSADEVFANEEKVVTTEMMI